MPLTSNEPRWKCGIASELQFATLGDGVQIEVTHEFVIECEIANVDVRIDGWRVRSAGAFKSEVGASFDGETIGMDLADAGEIEIVSGQVQTEGAAGGIVSGASSDDGIVVEEMHVIESDFAVVEMEVGIELLDGLTVGGGVVRWICPSP